MRAFERNTPGKRIRSRSPGVFASFVFVLLSLASAARGAPVSFDFETPVYCRPGEIVKDHSLIRVNGTYYLYFIVGTERRFGLATSADLRSWTRLDDVLRAGPGSWDAERIWAPTVVPYAYGPGYFLMYYTGVSASFAQRTCLALSHIPSLYSKASSPLFTPFHGDTAWIAWREDAWSNYRDPGFFMENDTFYLVHAAHTRDWKGAIALARSEDRFQWRDAGPLYVHDSWHALESPFLLKRSGLYHLFFTEETVGGVSHMASPSLTSGWDITKRRVIDGGAAAELLDLGADRWLVSRHTSYASAAGAISSIRFDTLRWNGDEPVVDLTSGLEGWTTLWGGAFAHQPVFGDNPRFRGDTTAVGFEGLRWIGTYEAFGGPLSGTSPGAVQGDGARGAIRSPTFVLTGLSMRLLVGGGDYPDSCYVALCDAWTNEILCRETGRGTDRMDERIWNLYPYRGRPVYLLIVDDCGAAFGHINVDGIEERMDGVLPPPDDGDRVDERTPRRKYVVSDAQSTGRRDDSPSPVRSLEVRPNPFNPSTEIALRAEPFTAVRVTVYDIAGRELAILAANTDASGRASVVWNGRDRRGRALPSGVYVAVLDAGSGPTATAKLVLAR